MKPPIKKTNRAFHAKDDAPEVRYLVYQCLANLDFKVQFVIARKIENIFRRKFHSHETEFYDFLISQLFQNVLHRYSHNYVYFANRGNRKRQAPLEQAIQAGINRFEERWKTKVETSIFLEAQTPVGEPCLQIIDYMNWAVYRAFTKQEMRYYQFVESKVSLLIDFYDISKYPHNWYNQKNPFDINKTSPL